MIKIFNIIIKLVTNIYFVYLNFIIFSIGFFYLFFFNYLNIYNLFISLLILIFSVCYKIILDLFCTVKAIRHLKKDDIILKYILILNEKILKKNKWLIKPIYNMLYYFPTNWPFLLIMWIGRKWSDIRLYINSNKDVIGKKYFKKDWSKKGSPLNSKYLVWFKKYIFVVFFRLLCLPLYFKISLIGKDLNKYLFIRIFGIIYSTVLIVNNLHLSFWFRTTDYISFWLKMFVILLLLYLFLYFFLIIINFFSENISIIEVMKLKGNSNENELKTIASKSLWINFYNCLVDFNLSKFLFVRNFLIMMILAEKFRFAIDCFYGLYITKNLNYSNINLPSNLIKLNKLQNSLDYFSSFSSLFPKYLCFKNNELSSHLDYVWIYEKNYRVSIFLTVFISDSIFSFYLKMLQYELYKLFYGEELIEKYFKEEIDEYKSKFFIYQLWRYWLIEELKLFDVMENLLINKDNNYADIPYFIKNNNEYNEVLNLSNFILLNQVKNLVLLNYNEYFNDDLALHISIIYSDIQRYENIYGNDEKKFLEFWLVSNKQSKDDVLMKLRFEIFSKHIPYVKKMLVSIMEEVKFTFLNKNKPFKEFILEKQEEYKKKYVFKEPVLNKSCDFLEKYKMKEEWKYFDEKKKKMFF